MPIPVCAVCGQEKSAGQVWFLLAESPWEDKLRILHWQDRLANRDHIHPACSPAHVQELVTNWMSMGTLDYPFPNVGSARAHSPRNVGGVRGVEELDTRGIHQIGEIAVDRESLERALEENPDALQVVLDELTDALEQELAGDLARFEWVRRMSPGSFRLM
jgi:hypothetical protein